MEGDLKMAVLGSTYRAKACNEIERGLRNIEKDMTSEDKSDADFFNDLSVADYNMDFARQLDLITEQQLLAYKERIAAVEEARRDFRNFERTESRHIVDDFENPRERVARYEDLDAYRRQINNDRASDALDNKRERQAKTGTFRSSENDDRIRK